MTPTLKQLWVTVRQLQSDMQQAKNQINEERALRSHLQQLLIGHLESSAATAAAAAVVVAGSAASVNNAAGQVTAAGGVPATSGNAAVTSGLGVTGNMC